MTTHRLITTPEQLKEITDSTEPIRLVVDADEGEYNEGDYVHFALYENDLLRRLAGRTITGVKRTINHLPAGCCLLELA